MQIRHILQQKGRDIVAISPKATMQEAAQLLAKKRIGAVLVRDGASLAGILSERKNVLGLMPHPENHVDPVVGPTDGRRLFESLIETLEAA